MEFRVLYYFLTVAREGNITKAAKILHITQPTLSRQMMQLEYELGVKLFARSNHSVSLTEEGMFLKRRAQELVSLAERTRQEFQSRAEDISGEIVIGSGEFLSNSLFAQVMSRFHQRHPLVRYRIYSGNADNIRDQIEQGLIDFGIVLEPVDIRKYDFLTLPVTEEWGILVREDSRLAEKEVICPQDLAGEPLVAGAGEEARSRFRQWMGECYDPEQILVTGNLLYNEAMMVESGMGSAFAMRLNCDYRGLRLIPLQPAMESRTVLIWKKDQVFSQAVGAFLRFVREDLAEKREFP